MRLKLCRWQRERIVAGTLCSSVVARMNMRCCRRLLQYLQQGVERRVAEHVHLVDDIDALVARWRGKTPPRRAGRARCRRRCCDAASISTTSRIEPSSMPRQAAHSIARVAVDRMLAVDRLGQDLGAGGLAGPARADEQIGVGQPSGLDLLFQRLGNMLLTDDVVKRLRPLFAIERLIHHSRASPPGTENIDKT